MANSRYVYEYGGRRYVIEAPTGATAADLQAIIGGSASKSSPAISDIDEEIKRKRERLERNRKLLSQEPTGIQGAVEDVLNFLGSKSGRQESLAQLESQTAAEIAKLQNKSAYIQRTGQAPRGLTTFEKALEVAKGLPRAAVLGLSDIAGQLGGAGETGEEASRYVAGLGEKAVSALGLSPDELAQYDPSLVRPTQFSEGVGSTLPLVAAQFAGRAALPLQVALSSGMGGAQQRRAIDEYEARTGKKVSALDRALAQAGGSVVGLTEMLPIPGLVEARGARAFQRVGRSAVEEGGQEAGSQALQNLVSKLTYNPEQEIGEGVLENAILGGAVGAGIRGGTEVVTRGREAAPQPKPERLINVRTEESPETGKYQTVVDIDGDQRIYDEPYHPDMIAEPLRSEPDRRTVVNINGEQAVFENGQIVPRETQEAEPVTEPVAEPAQQIEEPTVAAAPIGEQEAAPVTPRPFPTATPETADLEAAPAGYEPERAAPSEDAVRTPLNVVLPKEKFKEKVSRKMNDSLQRVAQFEQAVGEARGARVPFSESARDAMARYFGKASERIDEIDRDFQNPITKKLVEYNIPQQRLDEYLVAKSAPFRNPMIARINPEMPDAGSGMTTAEAQEVIRKAEEDGIVDQLEDLAGDTQALAKATREGMVRDQLITREQADNWEKTQPFYVPLKGISAGGDMAVSEEDTPHIDYNPAGFRARYKESMSPKGRGEENLPLSPLAYTFYDAKAAAIRGEKNLASNKFLELVEKNPSNVAQVFTKENPDTEMVPDPKTGVLRRQAVNMQGKPDKYFMVKKQGVPHYIKINDPLLMRALTNASAKDFEKLISYLNVAKVPQATRLMSNLSTTYNPVWAGLNYMKDSQSAIHNILAEQDRVDGRLAGKEIAQDVWKDLTSWDNFKKIVRITFDKEATTEDEREMFSLFQQAKEDGALTGWVMNEPVEQKIKDIQDAIDRAQAKGPKKLWYETKEGTAEVLQALQDFNSVFENITRFAVYKNALKAGLTREEAASMSREVTVDFNKRGELGPLISSLYSFANASIQGNARLMRSLRGSTASGGRTRAQKLALGLVGIGALQSVLGRAMSDDDKDGKSFYDKIPQYIKDRFIVIPHPWDGGETYSKLPLPYGISIFHNIGANVADFATGHASPTDLAARTLSSFANNFSPISVSFDSPLGFFNSFAPTPIKPVTSALINEDTFGNTIYNKPFREGEAVSNVPRFSTPEVYKEAVKIINEGTGGQGAVKSKIGLDIPAEVIPYLMEQYTGGSGRFISDMAGLTKNVAKWDLSKVSPNDIPYYNLIHSEVTSKAGLSDYYDRTTKIGPIERQLKNSTGAEKIKLLRSYPVETNSAVLSAKNATANRIKELNATLKKAQNAPASDARDKRIDLIDRQKTEAINRFNRIYNRIEEKQKSLGRFKDGGLVRPGNIDIHKRPIVHNPDGSISTVRSITVGFDDGVYVLPTVVGDKVVSDQEAIQHFRDSGEHLGVFKTEKQAIDYAKRLHLEQQKEYVKGP